jgi:outer membrane protein assembly factor BamD (BamD/ComL family)
MRLYARTSEYFPNSPLAAEALYRAGDIRWQIEYNDIRTLPSAKEQDPDVRPKIEEQTMREVMKKYPHTKWADLAAYHLLDNKVCGDWQAQSKCPERETELYEKYAIEHPQSPKAAEALYNAARRQAALIEIYKTEDQAARSTAAATRAKQIAGRLVTQYPDSEWASRALALQYKIEQNIPTYGSDKP